MSDEKNEVEWRVAKTLRCGCVLGDHMDHSHVEGCPSLQIIRLQEERDALLRVLANLKDAIDVLFEHDWADRLD